MRTVTIARPTIQSLHVKMEFGTTLLSTGTAFVAQAPRGPMLVTNRHNVTGRRQDNNQPLSQTLGIPDRITISHHQKGKLGSWVDRTEFLLKDGVQQWHEHPVLTGKADFVAVPLTQLTEVDLHPYDTNPEEPSQQMAVGPAEAVSVIGFPYGRGPWPIWATGFVASEPDLDHDDLPVMLIDCRTRQGQSGSPVIAYRNGGSITYKNGSVTMGTGAHTRFMGIYSGRINAEADIGTVWKTSAIHELLSSLR